MAKHVSSTGKFFTLFVLLILGWGFYQISDLFMPRFRWTQVRFEEIARQATAKGTPTDAKKLETQFEVVFAFAERGAGDPRPWVLLTMTPNWHEFTRNPDDDETGVMKRCAIISDRTGKPISGYLLGSGQYYDKFFRAKAWRLPPGSLGFPEERPVILFEAMTLQKLDFTEAEVLSQSMRDPKQWQPDDDGYEAPGAAK